MVFSVSLVIYIYLPSGGSLSRSRQDHISVQVVLEADLSLLSDLSVRQLLLPFVYFGENAHSKYGGTWRIIACSANNAREQTPFTKFEWKSAARRCKEPLTAIQRGTPHVLGRIDGKQMDTRKTNRNSGNKSDTDD